jgi:hypothetical protein
MPTDLFPNPHGFSSADRAAFKRLLKGQTLEPDPELVRLISARLKQRREDREQRRERNRDRGKRDEIRAEILAG